VVDVAESVSPASLVVGGGTGSHPSGAHGSELVEPSSPHPATVTSDAVRSIFCKYAFARSRGEPRCSSPIVASYPLLPVPVPVPLPDPVPVPLLLSPPVPLLLSPPVPLLVSRPSVSVPVIGINPVEVSGGGGGSHPSSAHGSSHVVAPEVGPESPVEPSSPHPATAASDAAWSICRR
jgi:hypothetical protein